jgi:hypothetical protein
MSVKFSEDVIPLADLKVNPGRVVKHAAEQRDTAGRGRIRQPAVQGREVRGQTLRQRQMRTDFIGPNEICCSGPLFRTLSDYDDQLP